MVHQLDNVTPSFGGTDGWNGEANNNLMNPAVFVYAAEVEFIDGVTLIYRGDVSLVR